MKLFTIRFLSIAFACLFISTAYANTPQASVEQVVKDFFFAGAQADIEKYMDNIDLSDLPEESHAIAAEQIGELMRNLKTTMLDPVGGLKSIDLTNKILSEDGNEARIHFVMTYGNGKLEEGQIRAVKVNGVWKVRLN